MSTVDYWCKIELLENYDQSETAWVIGEQLKKEGYDVQVDGNTVTVKLKDGDELYYDSLYGDATLFGENYGMVFRVLKHKHLYEIEFCKIRVRVLTVWSLTVSMTKTNLKISVRESS